MKILLIGDPHFKVANSRETELMSKEIIEICEKEKPNIIVCLGDVLDRHETIHVSPLERSVKFLHGLSKIAPLYILIGNHDRPNNSTFLTKEHPFTSLEVWDNTIIVDKPIHKNIENIDIVFVPYVYPGRFKEALSTLDFDYKKSSVIFAHQEFKGAKMGAIKSEIGDEWEEELPLVVSGHIHDFDILAKNIIYTGTPIQHAFGDKSDKSISLLQLKDGTFLHERIFLTTIPKKEIKYITTEELSKLENIDLNNKELKLVVSGNSSQIRSVMKLQNVKRLSSLGVKISYKETTDTNINIEDIKKKIQVNHGYISTLFQNIKKDKELVSLFNQLFGSLIETK